MICGAVLLCYKVCLFNIHKLCNNVSADVDSRWCSDSLVDITYSTIIDLRNCIAQAMKAKVVSSAVHV
jgi:hypothetical protein